MYFKLIGMVVASSLLIGCGSPAPVTTPTTPTTSVTPSPQSTVKADVTIELTKDGFVPNKVTINKGQTVAFVNRDSKLRWPASGNHPTHTTYPETGGCLGSKFDACHGLQTGESFLFTFNEVGTWPVHDHLNSIGYYASIEVK